MLMALMLCLGNVQDAVNSDTGYPMTEILVAGVNSNAGGYSFSESPSHDLGIHVPVSERSSVKNCLLYPLLTHLNLLLHACR